MAKHDRFLGARDATDQLMGLKRMTAVGCGGIEFYAGHCEPTSLSKASTYNPYEQFADTGR